MSHIGNKLRAGYFATPEFQGELLIKLLEINSGASFFDPTCGEGKILNQLAAAFHTDETPILTYGVELDNRRAAEAEKILCEARNAPIESMVISNNSFSLLLLNPPYDHTIKGIGDEKTERKEWTELVRNNRFLKENGLIIYIIPSYRYADKKISRYLASNFENVGVLRFSDEDYDEYKQCIFIGNKKRGSVKKTNKKLLSFLQSMDDEEFVARHVTSISTLIGKHKWNVPGAATGPSVFHSRLDGKSSFYEEIKNSKGFAAFKERSRPKQLSIGGNPALPINQGQMALLLASGAINGEIGKAENYHLVQGLELVEKVTSSEENTNENGSITITTKTRTKRSVSVKVITPEGIVKKLV
ncbi:DUF6094 domain-containing protein [Terribacillus saccharophilus]|uniref:DUF6094 domain-containing protein n=1 Tax=Terribacillus saccharophilus TaxID=361277 RepID=UPI003D28C4BF